MEAATGFQLFTGTHDFERKGIRFETRPVRGWQGKDAIVEDGNELVTSSWLDCDGSDCIVELLAPGELVTEEMKEDVEYRLRMRMAHLDLAHPNISLVEV